jgi:hypothetical protein
MKKILVVGCSYSALPTKTEYKSWTQFMGDDGYHVDNFAEHGAGNLVIKRILQTKLSEKKYDFVIVQWSTVDRWDYPINNHYELTGSNPDGYKKSFYNEYYNVYASILDTLDNIVSAQLILEKYNTPYTMISMGNLFEMEASVKAMNTLAIHKGDYSIIKINNLLDTIKLNSNLDTIDASLKLIDFNKFKFSSTPNNYFGGGMIEFLLNKGDYPRFKFHYTTDQHKLFYNEFIKPILNDNK